MSDFAVIAELPLGSYRARTPGEQLDPVPSPARLHAALLCAAGSGLRAVPAGADLEPCPDDLSALRWLEKHPPDGVHVPATVQVRTQVYAYRQEGTLKKEGPMASGPKDKVSARPMVGLVAVDGPFAWTWREPPPAPVRASLVELCPDVSHLGSADTPVRLHVGAASPTHRRDPTATLFSRPGLDVDVATNGRTDAMQTAYRAGRRAPSLARDDYATSEEPRSAAPVPQGRAPARYLDETPEVPDAPWETALLASFGLPNDALDEEDCVGWAVAVHRALVSLVGPGAPALLTGAYEAGAPRPANRVALQFLRGPTVIRAGLEPYGSVLALLLPARVSGVDLAVVSQAFMRLRVVRRGKTQRQVRPLPPRSAAAFWPVQEGLTRFRTDPATIADTRPLRKVWTTADALALSLGLVLRDRAELQGQGRGDARHRDTAVRVRAAGLHVHGTQRVRDGDLSRYVHRIEASHVVQPYRAELSLGGLLDDRSLVAVGQSRHLGGGLLVPVTQET